MYNSYSDNMSSECFREFWNAINGERLHEYNRHERRNAGTALKLKYV